MASPARSAGVVGLKPTAGLISRHGVYVVNKLQDSVGIFAKTVREAAFVLDVVATRNSSDSERRRTGAIVNPLDLYKLKQVDGEQSLPGTNSLYQIQDRGLTSN